MFKKGGIAANLCLVGVTHRSWRLRSCREISEIKGGRGLVFGFHFSFQLVLNKLVVRDGIEKRFCMVNVMIWFVVGLGDCCDVLCRGKAGCWRFGIGELLKINLERGYLVVSLLLRNFVV